MSSSVISSLVTDMSGNVQTNHGVPGGHFTYHSPRLGEMDLAIPQHPDVEEGRSLFANSLWNAAVVAAEVLERGSMDAEDGEGRKGYWDVRGKKVLELGAAGGAKGSETGTALPSIIAALSGALSVTITDHPSSPALITGAIEQNVQTNITERLDLQGAAAYAHTSASPPPPSATLMPNYHPSSAVVVDIGVFGYTWGTTTMYLPSHYGKPAGRQPRPKHFDRIIIADCLWMPSQHVSLLKTITHYLRQETSEPAASPAESSCALVVAGFHTGREIVRQFFEAATGEYRLLESLPPPPPSSELQGNDKDRYGKEGENEDPEGQPVQGRLRAAAIFEINVNGLRRPWEPVRSGEDENQTKRWCMVAVLVRR